MMSNRSTAIDKIPADIIKYGGEAMLTRMTDFMWRKGEVPCRRLG